VLPRITTRGWESRQRRLETEETKVVGRRGV
jgi:hypothetical protein